jgi:integrase
MTGSRKIHFTKRKLEELTCPEQSKQVYFFDDEVRGLEISVTPKGSKSFVYRRKVDGQKRRLWLGYFPDMTIDQARGKVRELNNLISDDVNVFDKDATRKEELTLEQLFDEYIERHAKKTRKTWTDMVDAFHRAFDGDKNDRSRKLSIDLRKKKISAINQQMAEQVHGEIAKKRGEYSANRLVQLLRAVYNKGKKWKLVDGENPFTGITLFQEKPRERFLSKEEAIKLLTKLNEEAVTEEGIILKDFISLSLFTGIRKANLMALEWSDVDFVHGTLTIPDTKNGTKQELAMGGHEISILAARKARQERDGCDERFVFPGSGKTGHLMDLKKSWTSFRNRAGLADVTIHDLRRSLGASMANANVNIALVKAALHHKDMKTTINVYARTQNEAVRDARELVHNVWLQGAGLTESPDNVTPLKHKKKAR